MKRSIAIIAIIISITVSFFVGSYHGYSISPGVKGLERLKELGMTDEDIAESISNISLYTKDYLKNMHADDMMGAIMGVNTLKALKKDDSSQIEDLAIMQITSYYNVYVDGSAPEDELEIKLQKEIQMLSHEFPKLKKKIESSDNN